MPQLICGTCGIEFYKPPSLVHKANYCSKECRIASYPPRITLTCNSCGKTYERAQCFVNPRRKNYCSGACRDEGHKRLNVIGCAVCGKEVVRRNCEVGKTNQAFCGRKCYAVWASGYFNKRAAIPCAQCGEVIHRKQHKLKDQDRQFCGRPCMHEWQSRNCIGENSPTWKGGSIYYYGPNWKQQARTARKRDGYCCRLCGVSQKKLRRSLDVHHLRPIREFDYKPGINDNYKAANELTNLISLCTKCHKRVERGAAAVQPYLL